MSKKNISKILLVGLLAILTTGCGSNKAINAINKTLKADNFDSNVSITIKNYGVDTEKATYNMVNNNKAKTIQIENVIQDEYYRTTMQSYYLTDSKDIYITSNSVALKEREEIGMGSDEEDEKKYKKNNYTYLYDLNTFAEIFKDGTVKNVENNTYKVSVDGNKFASVLNRVLYVSNYDYVRLSNVENMTIDFTVKTDGKYVKTIEADLTDYLKEATKFDEKKSMIMSYTFTYEVSNVGKSKSVTLPGDAKTDVEDYAQMDAKSTAYIYLSFINTLNLENGKYDKAEEYGNIIPENVSFDIKDGSVVGGKITINGYTFSYEKTDTGYEFK